MVDTSITPILWRGKQGKPRTCPGPCSQSAAELGLELGLSDSKRHCCWFPHFTCVCVSPLSSVQLFPRGTWVNLGHFLRPSPSRSSASTLHPRVSASSCRFGPFWQRKSLVTSDSGAPRRSQVLLPSVATWGQSLPGNGGRSSLPWCWLHRDNPSH